MIEPTKDDIGRSVIYISGVPHEEGEITSFNEHFVIVIRIEPDKDFIAALAKELETFNHFIKRVMEKIRESYGET